MKQKGLGKGLNALLSQEILNANNDESGIKMVDIDEIEVNHDQPRKQFKQEELLELSRSIKEHGILQPLIVREINNAYQIVAGERRYRAARMVGLDKLPILVKDFNEQETLQVSLIENIQRENLNSMELACAYSLLMERFDLTQEEIADKMGKSRPAVANIMRLMNLTPYVQQKLRDEEITYGHARAILGVKEPSKQKEITDYVIIKDLSVRETEKYINNLLKKQSGKKEPFLTNPFYKEIQENLQRLLGTKVSITKTKKRGKIEIEYYSDEELSKILSMIGDNNETV
jgi:ParB family chromosome partitioning protein